MNEILKFVGAAFLIYEGLGLLFFAFMVLSASVHQKKINLEDALYALAGALLIWPYLVYKAIIKD